MSENRLRDFKSKGKDTNEMRGRRREAGVELRKSRREDQLLKKRNVESVLEEITSPLAEQRPQSAAVSTLAELCEMIKCDDASAQLYGTTKCRMMLSKEKSPPIDNVIECGLVPFFIEFLARDADPQIQFEAAWALTNIASGTSQQTMAVATAGAIPHFIRLLSSANQEVQEQAVWALGNIAGDGPKLRDVVIGAGILAPLLTMIQTSQKSSILRNATWTLSNLCRGKNPQPNFAVLCNAIPTIVALLGSQDDDVITDACWAVSYMTDGENDKIRAIVSTGVVPRLVELLLHHNVNVATPALRALGNIVTGEDKETQSVVDAGALIALRTMMGTAKENIKKEVCWTLSNITAGSHKQIQAVIESGVVPLLLEAMRSGEFKTRKEAAWAVSNFTTGGLVPQIRYLVEQGCIQPVVSMLNCNDSRIIQVCLDCLKKILEAGEMDDGSNPCSTYIEECGGLDVIEGLQQHENSAVYHKALEIIETFFSEEEEPESSIVPQAFGFVAPAVAPTTFSF